MQHKEVVLKSVQRSFDIIFSLVVLNEVYSDLAKAKIIKVYLKVLTIYKKVIMKDPASTGILDRCFHLSGIAASQTVNGLSPMLSKCSLNSIK